jgi:hypothetical protein
MHKFKELEIWKKSRLYCSKIYSETAIFPLEEKGLQEVQIKIFQDF